MSNLTNIEPITVFYSYSHKDEAYKEELDTHLSILKRQGIIKEWHDRKIMPGKDWAQEINNNIKNADLILLLISPDFIASDYCYGIELKKALDSHENNTSKVVPIVIRPVDWQYEPISKLQALPKDATPVSTWQNSDEAWIDVSKGIRNVVSEINDVKNRRDLKHGLLRIRDHIKEEFKRIETLYEKQSVCGGLSTGFKALDMLADGFHPSDFVVIAARPSMGKTDFLVNVTGHIGIGQNIPVAFFSMKLPADQITKKLLCSTARVNSLKFSGGWLKESDWPKITVAAGHLAESQIFIDDSPTISLEELRQKAKNLQSNTGLGLIVLDSLHHFSDIQNESDTNQISRLTRSIKTLAKELKVPIIASAQVSRDVELRIDKRPQLTDLDNWHSLVEDADVVAFLYYNERERLYREDTKRGPSELIIGKNRNGPVGTAEISYDPESNLFYEINDKEE